MIYCYVDDDIVLQFDKHMNRMIIQRIAEHSGELNVPRRGKYMFLGIDVDFLVNGRVFVFMEDYIEESIASFGEALDKRVSSSSNNVLQYIN